MARYYTCWIPDCQTMHISTDSDDGCKACKDGFVRVSTTVSALVNSGTRALQVSAKTKYVCTLPPYPNCKLMHISTDPDAGCNICSPGYVREVGIIQDFFEGNTRMLQGSKPNYVCNVPHCTTMHISTDQD